MKKSLFLILSFTLIPFLISGLPSHETYAKPCILPYNLSSFHSSSRSNFQNEYIEYTPYYNTIDEKIEYTTSHTNKSSNLDIVTVTVSRVLETNLSVGGEAELDLIGLKVKAKAEVGVGQSIGFSKSIQLYVSPHSTKYIAYGSKILKTSGKIKKINVFTCEESTHSITAEYTTQEFSKTWEEKE